MYLCKLMIKDKVTINVNKENWIKFLIQSKQIGTSASQRIDAFIEKQIKKNEIDG